ncbi:hypothetical protein [Pseudonocardia asaccharolytica]|nr:hypothetical protein [Pseudonocardia asaccharolytica]
MTPTHLVCTHISHLGDYPMPGGSPAASCGPVPEKLDVVRA